MHLWKRVNKMKEQRMIKVIGTQRNAQGEESKIELVTEGNYYKKKDNFYLVYEESEISGMEGATTTLKIEGKNKVSMRRFGSAVLQLIFQEGKNFTSQYSTQFGNFEMKIFTKKLDVEIGDGNKGGSIEIHYDVWIKGLADTNNELKIQFM